MERLRKVLEAQFAEDRRLEQDIKESLRGPRRGI